MYADNEWKNIFSGHIVGNHVLGTWRAGIPGIFDHGVFIMRVQTKVPPELAGEFTGFDDTGRSLEIMHTVMVKVDSKGTKPVASTAQK